MDRALEYLQKIHEAVVDSAVKGLTDPIEVYKKDSGSQWGLLPGSHSVTAQNI